MFCLPNSAMVTAPPWNRIPFQYIQQVCSHIGLDSHNSQQSNAQTLASYMHHDHADCSFQQCNFLKHTAKPQLLMLQRFPMTAAGAHPRTKSFFPWHYLLPCSLHHNTATFQGWVNADKRGNHYYYELHSRATLSVNENKGTPRAQKVVQACFGYCH